MDRSAGATTRPDAPGIMLFRTSNHTSRNTVASAHICSEQRTHWLSIDATKELPRKRRVLQEEWCTESWQSGQASSVDPPPHPLPPLPTPCSSPRG